MIIGKTIGNFYFRSLTADDKDIYLRAQAEEKVVTDFYQKYPDTLIANLSRTLNNPDEHSIGLQLHYFR